MTPLRKLRLDAGWTTQELSDAADVGVATISALERGLGARVGNLVKLAEVLSVRLDRVVTPSELVADRRKAAA